MSVWVCIKLLILRLANPISVGLFDSMLYFDRVCCRSLPSRSLEHRRAAYDARVFGMYRMGSLYPAL